MQDDSLLSSLSSISYQVNNKQYDPFNDSSLIAESLDLKPKGHKEQ